MAHQWDRGVLEASSWHGLEEVGQMVDAGEMIGRGESSGAWPISLTADTLRTSSGLTVPFAEAIVGGYLSHPDRVLGIVGGRFRATACDEWRELVRAACAAGARPTGAFSLCEGSRTLATFEVGVSNGLKTQLLLVDAFDGSLRLTCGFTSIRVVCANTMSAALRTDGGAMAQIRHTASLEQKVNALAAGIGEAIAAGTKVKDAYERARNTFLNREQARAIFDSLFPEAGEGDSKGKQTRAENAREEARRAAALPVNREGDRPGNLATIWNAATYLVDRNGDGSARKTRGDSDALDSLLFGSRADRVQEIETKICLVMRDGTEALVSGPQAVEAGIDSKLVGKKLLEDMLVN
jgi:hypothetical protein